jgi:proteasome lid subunit RPN8/RPN11
MTPSQLLNNPLVRSALKQAWRESNPGSAECHEEGGFILRDTKGNLSIMRWARGTQNTITLPLHSRCKIGEKDIVASFHTHPNTGGTFLQEPSETDRRAVRDDPDLKGAFYVGEFVISAERVYLVSPEGQVNEIGYYQDVLG